jgi:hypothetical protein
MTRRLLTLAALAVTLSAQTSSFVDRSETRSDSTVRQSPGVYIVDPTSGVSTESWRGPSPQVTSAPATTFDNNGALEAFYAQPAHHSIFKSRKFWIGVGVMAGSGVLAGYLASRGPAHSFGPAASIQQPVAPEITVNGPTFIGIGGPGLPVVIGGKK